MYSNSRSVSILTRKNKILDIFKDLEDSSKTLEESRRSFQDCAKKSNSSVELHVA